MPCDGSGDGRATRWPRRATPLRARRFPPKSGRACFLFVLLRISTAARATLTIRAPSLPASRSKHKAVHKTTSNDDKRLDNTVKRLGVQQIPGIEEVNIFQEDSVIHYTNPTVKASIAANTYVVSGPSSTKKLQDLLPGIINQLGPDNLANLKKIAAQYGADGDDVPDVKSFE